MKFSTCAVTALMVLCILASGFMACGNEDLFSRPTKEENETGGDSLFHEPGQVATHLYFLDKNHQFLRAEQRTLAKQDALAERAKNLVNALIDGPKSELIPTLPKETELLALYVTKDAIAYVDLGGIITEQHPGGTLTELFTMFSVVNTLALNLEEVERVKILIQGREIKSVAGHIDCRFPFSPNILMIK